MNDSRLEQLIRMAVEADELASGAPESDFASRPVYTNRRAIDVRFGRNLRWVPYAAAAGVAIAVVGTWFVSQYNNVQKTRQLASHTSKSISPIYIEDRTSGGGKTSASDDVAASIPEQNVVVAIFHDPISGQRCVKWREHDWTDNKCLSDVESEEVQTVNVGRACTPMPRQVLMIALSGPQTELPTNDTTAAQLADCILEGDRYCDSVGTCYVPATTRCVSPNVSFKIETMSYK